MILSSFLSSQVHSPPGHIYSIQVADEFAQCSPRGKYLRGKDSSRVIYKPNHLTNRLPITPATPNNGPIHEKAPCSRPKSLNESPGPTGLHGLLNGKFNEGLCRGTQLSLTCSFCVGTLQRSFTKVGVLNGHPR